ncbi:hypothetical protein, partial [Actinomadura sp. HBU206391]|uniref:hypothetical protein n=1 Tax=Actinomadura sp. HBU206391 TaxID=2731692 RepID=UPI001C9D2FF4
WRTWSSQRKARAGGARPPGRTARAAEPDEAFAQSRPTRLWPAQLGAGWPAYPWFSEVPPWRTWS